MSAATNKIVAALQEAAKNCTLTGIYIRSVSIAATHNPDLDVVMRVTWSMPTTEIQVDNQKLKGVSTTVMSRPDDMVIQLDNGDYVDQLESEILTAAWLFGAWDMCRLESPPIPAGENPCSPGYGIVHDFGFDAYKFGEVDIKKVNINPTQTIEQAAKSGRVSWRFIPLSLTTPEFRSRWTDKDKTLNSASCRDGYPSSYRAPWQLPITPGFGNEHIYQLGRSNHGNRSKKSNERRG